MIDDTKDSMTFIPISAKSFTVNRPPLFIPAVITLLTNVRPISISTSIYDLNEIVSSRLDTAPNAPSIRAVVQSISPSFARYCVAADVPNDNANPAAATAMNHSKFPSGSV